MMPVRMSVSAARHAIRRAFVSASAARAVPKREQPGQNFKVNADGSVDVYFGPKAPAGFENNWVQTIPGKGWFTILRLYGPLDPWFNKKKSCVCCERKRVAR